jgi:predicted nucleic acid-binding Zn ribbon protein
MATEPPPVDRASTGREPVESRSEQPVPNQAADADGLAGPQLAHAVLDAARAKRADRPRRRAGTGAGPGSGRRLRGYSGPGADPRDPQPFGALLDKLVKARGWQKPAAEARIFGSWAVMVGDDLATHSRPVKLENGELTVEAESTAWATQIRLLTNKLLTRIAAEVGRDVVTKLHVHGPVAPSWLKGPKRVRGRGPRDTYG